MVIQVYDDDMLNGKGLREVVFFQGCSHRCPGCFNPETWEFKGETKESIKIKNEFFKRVSNKLDKDYIDGITLTGGDPLEPKNVNQALEFIMLAKSKNKTVWVYTGYLYEQIKDMYPGLITLIDVLCDGPFIQSLKSPEKPWVGSSNQRVIDVQESLRQNKVVLV